MVNVILKDDKFIFKIMGWHQIWALHSGFTFPKSAVIAAYQDPEELKNGRLALRDALSVSDHRRYFHQKGERNFWDVTRGKNTIIVTLYNQVFDKLYIEVKNPQETLTLLNSNK
jgi:hypothetical protein